MNKLNLFLVTCLFLGSLPIAKADAVKNTSAKKVSSRKLASDAAPELVHLTVTFGDKVTDFSLKGDSENYSAEISSYPSTQRTVPVQKKDADYLLSKFNALSAGVDTSAKCPRQTLIANGLDSTDGKGKHVGGCIGADTPESKGLLSLANSFSALF